MSKGFTKFCGVVLDTLGYYGIYKKDPKVSSYYSREYFSCLPKKTTAADITPECVIRGNEVYTGGMSGGSCYDNGDRSYHSEPGDGGSPELESLDKILEVVCPDITFLKYKLLLSKAEITTETYGDSDYYGNTSNYAWKQVSIGKLYDALLEIGVLSKEYTEE